MPPNPPLTIVIPVYNEGANFRALWNELASGIKTPLTAFVVYDFDEDSTLPAIRAMTPQLAVRLVRNDLGRGVLNAMKVSPSGRVAALYLDHALARAAGGTSSGQKGTNWNHCSGYRRTSASKSNLGSKPSKLRRALAAS